MKHAWAGLRKITVLEQKEGLLLDGDQDLADDLNLFNRFDSSTLSCLWLMRLPSTISPVAHAPPSTTKYYETHLVLKREVDVRSPAVLYQTNIHETTCEYDHSNKDKFEVEVNCIKSWVKVNKLCNTVLFLVQRMYHLIYGGEAEFVL